MPSETTSTPEPLAKRRKLSGVHKPFVSPLKQRNSTNQAAARPTSSDGIFKKPATPASNLSKITNNFTPHHPTTRPSDTHSSISTSTPRRPTTSLPTSCNPILTTTPSQSTSTISLQTHLSHLRTQLDTLKQTQRILSLNTDAELLTLRTKWHTATRSAAEELYATVKDRVNRMGGVGAWRESEMRKRDRVEEWAREDRARVEKEEDFISDEDDDDDTEDSDEEDSDEEDLEDDEKNKDAEAGHGGSSKKRVTTQKVKPTPTQKARAKAERKAQRASLRASRLEARDAQREARAIAKAEMAEENEEAELQEREMMRKADLEKGLVGGDDDGYTMAMMLSQLNVDFDMIGFDREAGRWID